MLVGYFSPLVFLTSIMKRESHLFKTFGSVQLRISSGTGSLGLLRLLYSIQLLNVLKAHCVLHLVFGGTNPLEHFANSGLEVKCSKREQWLDSFSG